MWSIDASASVMGSLHKAQRPSCCFHRVLRIRCRRLGLAFIPFWTLRPFRFLRDLILQVREQ